MGSYRREDGTVNERSLHLRFTLADHLRALINEELEAGVPPEEVVGMLVCTVVDLVADINIRRRLS